MKKYIVMVLLAAITLSCLGGCGETAQNPSGAAEVEEIGDTGGLELPFTEDNTEIKWVVSSSYTNLNDTYVLQKLRQLTGVNIQLQVLPTATVGEKVKVLVASRDIPDIIGSGFSSIEDINDLGVQGAFAKVNDYFDIMPNYKKLYVDNPENNWVLTSHQAADGGLYMVHGYDVSRDVNHGVLYRKDIFDKHGIPMWNSPEEFYQALLKLKQNYPESQPFTSKMKDGLFRNLSVSWGINAFEPYYDEAEKVWKYSDTDPEMKNMLDYLKKLYDEGLLDREFLTMTQAAWTSKMTQADKAFVTWDWIGRLDMFQEQAGKVVPGYDLRYGNPIGPKGTVVTLSKVGPGTPVAKNKNTEISLKLLDFLLSPAGAELTTMGKEGETYELNDRGKATFPDFPVDKKVEITDLEEKYGMFIAGACKRYDRRSSYFDFSEREQEAQDFAVKGNRFEPADPELAFTNEEKEVITDKKNKLINAAKETFSQYILGSGSGDAAWNAWLAKAQQMGADDLVKIYNDAQKRFEENR